MDIINWIAILGALAWLPHLILLIRNLLTKPQIRVIAPRNVSVGFTTYGPIFNLHLAFSVKNKSIVVSSLKIKLEHESGEEKKFEWQGIQQELMKMRAPDGSILPYQKDNSVLAMKLNEKDIEERFIQFQDPSFQTAKYDHETKLVKTVTYLTEQQTYDPRTFLDTQDMQEFFQFIKQAFSWKVGIYKVTVEINSPDQFNLIDNRYEFILSPVDVAELEKNKDHIRHDHENILVPQTEEEHKPVIWNWINPTLKKIV